MNIFETLNASAEAWELRYTDKFLVDLVGRMNELADTSGLTRREIAERAGWKEPYLSRVLSGQQNLTLRSLAKFEAAVNDDVLTVTSAHEPAGQQVRWSSHASPVRRLAASPDTANRAREELDYSGAANDYGYALAEAA